MRILVFPHDLGMGGSQINAIEIAAAVRDLGHEVVVFGRPGPLLDDVERLGLEFVPSPAPHVRPTPSVVRALSRLAKSRGLDILHGYEWPPILEARLACAGSRAACVGTVMSMSVAPFIPAQVPLVVGTAQIAHAERRRGRHFVEVIEPPVDVDHNRPNARTGEGVRGRYGVGDGPLVVAVSRLVPALKLEGLLCALSVVPRLSPDGTLLIAGGGSAQAEIARAAAAANASAGRRAVVLTGELSDPRPVYAAADVVLGMGGSALRGMAFAKPVVVQGERGFWQTLTPASLGTFLWTGWYGVGAGAAGGPSRLVAELGPLLADSATRADLGEFGRTVVEERFSLAAAVRTQMRVYEHVLRPGPRSAFDLRHDVVAGARLAVHTARGEVSSRLGRRTAEDFNARPVAARAAAGRR